MSAHLVSATGENTIFIMYRNNEELCGINEDFDESSTDEGTGSCSVTVELNTGKEHYTVMKVTHFES